MAWSAGVKAPDVPHGLGGLENNRINQLVVTPSLQTTRDLDVFAIGDCAACPLGDSGATIPPRAQAAHQQASRMVRTLRRRLGGLAPEPFVYRDFGSLVSLGRYGTVGSLMGFVAGRSLFIEGHFARMAYRSPYKMHQTALHGSTAVLWRLVARYSSQGPEPGIKPH